jgi:hypothetical protein
MGPPATPTPDPPQLPRWTPYVAVLVGLVGFGASGIAQTLVPQRYQLWVYLAAIAAGATAFLAVRWATDRTALARWGYLTLTLTLTLTFAAGTMLGSALWLTLGPAPLAQRLSYLPLSAYLVCFAGGTIGETLLSEDNRLYPIAKWLDNGTALSVTLIAGGVAGIALGADLIAGGATALGVAIIAGGVATIAMGAALIAGGATAFGVALTVLGVATIAMGADLIALGDTAGGAALIALGVALIAGGVAIITEGDTALNVALIAGGVAAIALGVAGIARGDTAFGVATIAVGVAGIAMGVACIAGPP